MKALKMQKKNKMILQKSMVVKSFYILIIFLVFVGCDNTKYQVLKVDNRAGTLEVLNGNYIIDSVAFEKDDNLIFSMALKNKTKGRNKLDLKNISSDYLVYTDNMNFKGCEGASGIAFIRQDGFSKKITDSIEKQKKFYQEIQQFWFDYRPCQDSIMKIDALRRLK